MNIITNATSTEAINTVDFNMSPLESIMKFGVDEVADEVNRLIASDEIKEASFFYGYYYSKAKQVIEEADDGDASIKIAEAYRNKLEELIDEACF